VSTETKKMNPEIKERWIAALESGEYPQGRGLLVRDGNYCCLGVLTDLAVKDGVCEWTDGRGVMEPGDGDDEGYLEDGTTPNDVQEWAGLPDCNPSVSVPAELAERLWPGDEDEHGPVAVPQSASLAELNDAGAEFSEIAALIRSEL
jgi:hypothetical protein